MRALFFYAALAGCYPTLPDRYASERPMSDRAPAASREAQRACGPMQIARESPIERAPYVQDVRPDRAIVMWASRGEDAEALEIYAPDDLGDVRRFVGVRVPLYGSDDVQRAVSIPELRPSTAYCYELRGAERELLYGPIAFRSAPDAGSSEPIDVVVLGDSGGSGNPYQRAVRDRMLEVQADLVLHAGDLAYPASTTARLEREVFDVYEPLLRSIPFYPAVGNHDLKVQDGAPFRDVFVLPENGERERYYAFDWGMLHVAVLDTQGDLERQARWLHDDLARTSEPWTIVMGHAPLYSSGQHGGDARLAHAIGPVLAYHRVPLVLAGHDHHYERTREVDGTTFIVTGGGGHSVRAIAGRSETAFAEAVLHFVHLHIERDALVIRAIDATGRVFDVHTIAR
jgi:predicted phosphodiesterase